MNTSSEPRRCPACSAEIPAEAPQGLCPKCLLLGVASVAEPSVNPGGSATGGASHPGAPQRGRADGAAKDNRSTPPSVEELAAAFPQLEILELIGCGGMGFVYKARQPKLDRLVALKILPGHLASEPSFHERFEREARVLAKLQHPLIVSVYDFGEATSAALTKHHPTGLAPVESGFCTTPRHESGVVQRPASHWDKPSGVVFPQEADGTGTPRDSIADTAPRYFYLMLEYVDGVNLREAMRAGRFTPDQALAIVPQVCEALQYAHSKGVLHRDIKPENILLDTDGRVKIADFGIAKVLGPEMDASSSHLAPGGASESERVVTRLTATGSVLGTPLYMAPEQLISPNSVDHRADIFSLGVVFYEMLTGELPMGRFAPPSEKSLANQQIDQRIDEVVLRALAKERELRQQSAGEMKTEVETISSTPRPRLVPAPVPIAAASHRRPDSSNATGGGIEPPVNVPQTAELPFPSWLLTDVGRVLLALLVVSILSAVIPLVLMIVTAPIWILDVILFQSTTAWIKQIYQPWRYARDIGQFVAVTLCVVVDAALLTLIWRYWLRHISPRRAGASLRWLFTPYPVEQRRSSEQSNSTTSAPRTNDDRFERPASSTFTGERDPAPVSPFATDTARGAVSGNTSGNGGWWALASLFIGHFYSLIWMVGLGSPQIGPSVAQPPQLTTLGKIVIPIVIVTMLCGMLIPIWLGWRHLLRQHREQSGNGIIPAMIAAWFLPLLILDVVLFYCIVGPLDRYQTAQWIAQYVAPLLCVIVDGVILSSTWRWATHSSQCLPASLKSARLWYPLGWTVLSAFVGWGAFEAVQSYGRYEFSRIDESVEMLEAKSGGYFVRANILSYTSARGNRTEPTPERAYLGMSFIRQTNTERGDSGVEVELPRLMIRRSRAVPDEIPLNEENLLVQMKRAGIVTTRLEVAAEARSLIETADKLRTALLNRSQIPLVNLIDQSHWKLTTRPRYEGVVRHGWDVTHHTARGSLSIRVNQDDALRVMVAVIAFWLIGLAVLLGFLPMRRVPLGTSTSSGSSESPWTRRIVSLVTSLAGLAVVVTVIAFLPLVAKLATQSPPAPQPGVKQSPVPHVTVETGTAAAHDDAATPTAPLAPPQAVSAAEADAKRLGLIRVFDAFSEAHIVQKAIELKGVNGYVVVEPHFSAMVVLPQSMNRLEWNIRVFNNEQAKSIRVADYPCDYIACDWTSGTDNPRIMGYILPPGAYDFRADAETTKLLNEMDSTKRAKIAAGTLMIIRAAALKSVATESDWQQATQAAHVRFKFVPKSISKLSVPDECLIVLTDDSRTVFTREGGRFTKRELAAAETLKSLKELLKLHSSPADATTPENVPR